MRLNTWHRISACFAVLTFCLLASGCSGSPSWLTDLINLVPVLVSAATSLATFIAGLLGGGISATTQAEITAWSDKVTAGLKNVQALISEYQTTPDESTLQKVEQAAQLVISDISALGAIAGVPAATLTKLQAFAQLMLNQLEALLSLIPALAPKAQLAGTKLSVIVPMDKETMRNAWNHQVDAPTGDVATDAALAATKHI